MEEFRKRFIYLCHFPGITWNEVFITLKKDPQLLSITHRNPKSISQCKFPDQTTSNTYREDFFPEQIHDQIRKYPLNSIEVITYFDDTYPFLLKEIYQPPWCLFVRGNVTILNKPRKIAIVGSRQATTYGKNAIQHIIPPLIEKEIVIVSGLAKGIDSLAHQLTMDFGGQTIAVIAGGLNYLYPRENERLAGRIGKEHVIISEYPPETRPEKWHFPARNRIISGLCEGTLLIEAKRKSGSLITANYAVQEGRDVFAVPGSIFSPFSEGTNDLIQQGAKLVMSGEDILAEIRS